MYIYELTSVNEPVFLELQQINLRLAQRVECNMPVHFQMIKGKKISSQVYEGIVGNFSCSGMKIKTELQMEAHREIRLHVTLSLFSKETAYIYAKVLLSEKTSDGFYETRLEYTVIDDKTQAALQAYVTSVV